MATKPGGVVPVLLPALGGMFVVSLLDAVGVISAASPLTSAIYYGLFGACADALPCLSVSNFLQGPEVLSQETSGAGTV